MEALWTQRKFMVVVKQQDSGTHTKVILILIAKLQFNIAIKAILTMKRGMVSHKKKKK